VKADGQCEHAAPGFTLIEVLVALVIVAIGMAAVMGALTSSASTVSYLRDKTFSQWVALNQIASTRLTAQQQRQAPQTGNTDGDVDFAGRSWHWRQEITATDLPGIVRIDVMVRPADSKPDNDKESWYSTVSGMYGDAVAPANGELPAWGTGNAAMQPGAPASGSFQINASASSLDDSSSSSSSGSVSSSSSSSSASSSSSSSQGLR
jgi:general secretion pathway protein I